MEQLTVWVDAAKTVVGILLLSGGVFAWYRVRKQVRIVSKAMFGTPSLKEGLEHQADILAETPKSVSGMTKLCLPQIERDFPEFHWAQWKQRCENILKGYLSALERQNPACIEKDYEELRRQAEHQIEDQKRRGVREVYRQVRIHQTEISRYQKEAGLCMIKLQSAVEYYYEEKKVSREEDEKDKTEPPQGSVRQQHRYNMELVYIQDITKVGDYATVLGATCPNCGAPITKLGSKFCEYCGTGVIPIDIRVWKVHRIEKE